MTKRSEQIARRAQPDGQVRSLHNLKTTPRYVDLAYGLSKHHLERGDTGRLRVFSLEPRIAGLPSFEARVDDGSPGRRREPDLDFDIKGAPDNIARDFKAGRNGYSGHHSNRSSDSQQRIYEVKIFTPNGRIFEGEVSFNVNYLVGVHEAAEARDVAVAS